MPRKTESSKESVQKLHLRYIRLPNQVLDIYDDLIYKSEKAIVIKSKVTSEHSVVFDGKIVLKAGFQIFDFELMGKWFTVCKVKDLNGLHTGYYCDIVTPPKPLNDSGVELTDLFLDLWVSPDLRYKVLDKEELEDAFRKDWITEQLYEKAKEELSKLVRSVNDGKFPPYQVKCLEKRLCL